MNNHKNKVLGKVLYAVLFMIIFPMLLVLWAYFTAPVIILPTPGCIWADWILILSGLGLAGTGIGHLWILRNQTVALPS